MKRLISTILVVFVCFVLQTTLFQTLALADVVPNLLLIATVAYGYMGGEKEGILVGLLCGLLIDLFFGSVIGLNSLILMIIGYLNGVLNKIYYTDDLTIPLIIICISDIFYNFLYYMFEFLLRGRLNLFFYLKRIILPEVVYTVLISVILYKLLHTLHKHFSMADNGEV